MPGFSEPREIIYLLLSGNLRLKDGLDLSLADLMDLDKSALLTSVSKLVKVKSLNEEHLEQLCDLFDAWANAETLRKTRLLLAQRALLLLNFSDRISANYSFSRAGKITKLRNFILNQQK